MHLTTSLMAEPHRAHTRRRFTRSWYKTYNNFMHVHGRFVRHAVHTALPAAHVTLPHFSRQVFDVLVEEVHAVLEANAAKRKLAIWRERARRDGV